MRTLERHRWGRVSRGAAGVAILGFLLGACRSSPSATTTSSSTSSSTGSTAAATGVTVASTSSSKYGTILVTSSGKTLYMLTADSSTASACTASCASAWPPLTTTGNPRAGSGVEATLLGTITRSQGSKQVTYAGHPLYTYVGDSAAGQVNGEGIASFGGTWFVLNTSGTPLTPNGSSGTTTTSSGGYSY
jgi:predicted lipoprotein with Yx(FWY)xxD motif